MIIYYKFIYKFSGDWECETLKNKKIENDVDDVNSINKTTQESGKIIATRMNFQLKSIELEEFQRIELLSQIETIGGGERKKIIFKKNSSLYCILCKHFHVNM
jgi:hypothetical protein